MYLPYECTDNRDEFIDCLAKLGVFIDNINSTYITIVGDFNVKGNMNNPGLKNAFQRVPIA